MSTDQQYLSTNTLCTKYEVEKKFFLRRIESGEFVLNKHFIKRGSTLRWCAKAIDEWWRGDADNYDEPDVDDLINKLLVS